MPRKKVVFVIVEGPSEDEALSLLLSKIYKRAEVFVYIEHGDITTQSKSSNILANIGNLVKRYAKSNHFDRVHFQEIIHIVDTDGVYVTDETINEDLSAESPIYTLTRIFTSDVPGILSRNRVKRDCLDKISSTSKIWGIPYQAYYMSCNLDHVLYNKMNSSDEEKEKDAIKFAKRYKEDVSGFVKFVLCSDFSVKEEYRKSWEYIRYGLHSLERHTNFCICLNRALSLKCVL